MNYHTEIQNRKNTLQSVNLRISIWCSVLAMVFFLVILQYGRFLDNNTKEKNIQDSISTNALETQQKIYQNLQEQLIIESGKEEVQFPAVVVWISADQKHVLVTDSTGKAIITPNVFGLPIKVGDTIKLE